MKARKLYSFSLYMAQEHLKTAFILCSETIIGMFVFIFLESSYVVGFRKEKNIPTSHQYITYLTQKPSFLLH